VRGDVIELTFPDIDPEFIIRGRVVWCTTLEGGGFEAGVEFDSGFSPLQDRIFDRIREIETYRQTVADVEGRRLSAEAAAKEWLLNFGSRLTKSDI